MERVPDWMQAISVDFVCNNCPKRQLKNIVQIGSDLFATTPKPAEPEVANEDSPEAE